ncbi:hypothetical protein FFI16_009220 [Pseudomonas sp. KBS0710]|uniref:hypothetical protein n=1 Tax=Pseudomonas sp. KBS0710 TaxID=1179667 RepID=UPI00110F4AA8|nr:hypothetical protein [Pseudomonas sp. KBS0710]TSD76588.1 hypothetical protein FFI16_009220 [Pseudomonas sp. KBS0710]
MKKPIVLAGLIALISACSGVKSIPDPAPDDLDGLIYYMPMKDLIVSIAIGDENKLTSVTIGTSTAYADRSVKYSLSFQKALLANNDINIGTNSAGLLKSATSETTAQVSEIFKALGSAVGTVRPLANNLTAPECTKGSHVFVYKFTQLVNQSVSPCGVTVTAKRYDNATKDTSTKRNEDNKKGNSGIFYKQEIAYLISATRSEDLNASQIVTSPSESPVYFLPISKTLFSSSKADFTFEDGIPTKFAQKSDSELVSLFSLPATIVGAYFEAVGKVFTSFKSNDDKQVAALQAELTAEIQKRKTKECMAAVKDGRTDDIEKLGCI